MSPRMGELAALDQYSPDAFDVPLDQGTNVGWANRAAEALYAPRPDDPTVVARTASPLVNITEGDIGRATEAAMGVSGGGLSTKGIKAYHSSPHDFDRFDLSKIGTGEGAQMYGHGLYFAENPAVSGQGGQYWNQFLGRFSKTPEGDAARRLKGNAFDREAAIAENEKHIEQLLSGYSDRLGVDKRFDEALRRMREENVLLHSGKPVGPRTYEVNINADPAHFLDWDKGLHRQSPEVQEALARRLGIKADPAAMRAYDDLLYDALHTTDKNFRMPPPPPSDPLGADIYRNKIGPAAVATRQLREAGIPGIKYLDEGSRGVQRPVVAQTNTAFGNVPMLETIPSPKQTHNYVVFDDKLIDILKKYGLAGAAPVGLGSLAAQDRYQPE